MNYYNLSRSYAKNEEDPTLNWRKIWVPMGSLPAVPWLKILELAGWIVGVTKATSLKRHELDIFTLLEPGTMKSNES